MGNDESIQCQYQRLRLCPSDGGEAQTKMDMAFGILELLALSYRGWDGDKDGCNILLSM